LNSFDTFGPLTGDEDSGASISHTTQPTASNPQDTYLSWGLAASGPDSGERDLNPDESSRGSPMSQGVSSARPLILTNKDILFAGPPVTFIENGVATGEVSHEEEHVHFQARKYVSQGKKLSLS